MLPCVWSAPFGFHMKSTIWWTTNCMQIFADLCSLNPSISNLHPPLSSRSLWIKRKTFGVELEDLLRQPGPVGMTNATSLPMFNVRFIDMLG